MVKELYKLVIVFIMVVFSFVLALFIGQEVALSGQAERQNSHAESSYRIVQVKKTEGQELAADSDNTSSSSFLDGLENYFFPKKASENEAYIALEENSAQISEKIKVEDQNANSLSQTASLTEQQDKVKENHDQSDGKAEGSVSTGKQKKEDSRRLTDAQVNDKKSSLLDRDKKADRPAMYGIFLSRHTTREGAMEQASQIKLSFPHWNVFFKKSSKVYKVYMGPFDARSKGEALLMQVREKKEFKKAKIENLLSPKKRRKKLAQQALL